MPRPDILSLALILSSILPLLTAPALAQSKGPTDWSDWEKYRDRVIHPATTIKPEDLERARQNIERYDWAKGYVARLRESADAIAGQLNPAYLERMLEVTTPGCYGPCPACRAKGLPWHPNGQWSWSASDPDKLTCRVCKTVFPNDEFPEEIVVRSKWDPRQRFSFVGGETFKCFGYTKARPSITAMIRRYKVSHVTGQLGTLATAYALTDDPRYARAGKAILLRFAEVLPKYLVRAGYGYGEFCDTDPHVAAERISDLPNDEIVYPPNKPDRKLYAGYWAASRIGSSGQDGRWVARVTEAYDLTCTARDEEGPVYSRDEQVRIERDVLLEGTYLAVCDPRINNKSVSNRAGAAMVGLCVGHPGLVRFGIEGFTHTVDDWFLPDGGTSESPAYAMMTMSGIRPFGLAFRDYSDPEGYAAPDGSRLDHFNACRDTRYGDCWQGLIWTLQGNLRHPPSADSYRTTRIGASYAELIAVAYPTDEHIALLKELAGEDLAGGSPREAIFYREPGLETRAVKPLSLPDVVFPFLAQGYVRTGDHGRKALLMLNASDWGGHHHLDSLNLYYWQDGRELLSDLGYLWDHPDKHYTRRTFAHNLVLIDGKEQRTRGRGGSFHIFAVTPHVKIMEASSQAYEPATEYRRTCILVDHGDAGAYVVDIFRAAGGNARECVFHGPGNDYEVSGLQLRPSLPSVHGGKTGGVASAPLPDYYTELEGAQHAQASASWHITWNVDDDYQFSAWSPGADGETVVIGGGWGQRDHRNTDRGATLPYVIRRRVGENGTDIFATVFAGGPKVSSLVRGVSALPLPDDAPKDAIALAIDSAEGLDVIVSMVSPETVAVKAPMGEVVTDGRVAVVLINGDAPEAGCLVGGTTLKAKGVDLSSPAARYSGDVIDAGSEAGESYFAVTGELPRAAAPAGTALFVAGDDDIQRAYPIRRLKSLDGVTRIFTKTSHTGFEARPAKTWQLLPTVTWKKQ